MCDISVFSSHVLESGLKRQILADLKKKEKKDAFI